MKIAYELCKNENHLIKLLDEFQNNGWDLNKEYHKITHTGDYYAMFYDEKMESIRNSNQDAMKTWEEIMDETGIF